MSYKHRASIVRNPSMDSRACKKPTVVGSRLALESSPALETPSNRMSPPTSRIPVSRPLQSVRHDFSTSRSLTSSTPSLPQLVRNGSTPQSSAIQSRSSSQTSSAVEKCSETLLRRDDYAETDIEVQDREDADALNEIIMAIECKSKGLIGCAYYVAREEKLYMMQDIQLGELEIIETLKLRTRPTDILISTRADEDLENALRRDATNRDNGDEKKSLCSGSYILDIRPSSEFEYTAAKNKLMSLNFTIQGKSRTVLTTAGDDVLGNVPFADDVDGMEGSAEKDRYVQLASRIDLESYLTIGCAGAVLSCLQRRKAVGLIAGNDNVAFRIASIETFAIGDAMYVNAETLSSLQVLQSEFHPNSHMQGATKSGAKESLSIYGLFNKLARTPQGKHRLRQIFLRPSTNIDTINERLNTLLILSKPYNADAYKDIVKNLKSIKNIRTVIIHLKKGITSKTQNQSNNSDVGKKSTILSGVWGSLLQFALCALALQVAIRSLRNGEKLSIVAQIIDTFHPLRLAQISGMIDETVDFEMSAIKNEQRTIVKQGIDQELDETRRVYDSMEPLFVDMRKELISDLPEWARRFEMSFQFWPQLGFLTAVPLDPQTGKGVYEGEGDEDTGWELMFKDENTVYYKNRKAKEMDRHWGDLYGSMCDKEVEIIHALATRVLAHEQLLIKVSDLCGELDCLVALAEGARRNNLVPPQMTTDNVIQIKDGRHLLQELTVPCYVANDTCICGGEGNTDQAYIQATTSANSTSPVSIGGPSMLIMTGPNYSGKSVYLKQIALIVYLAHIGSFVPAAEAKIGITDKILTRIATQESVSRTQSAFMIDLQQIAQAVTMATRRSLLVIDEFGKGTTSSDGAGLACGVLEYFVNLGPERPKVLAATHFHEIFELGFLIGYPEIAFGHMEVRVNHEEEMVEDQITYLYQFTHGRSLASFGTTCAAINGMDSKIVERANDLILMSARGDDLVAGCSRISESELRDLKIAEEAVREFLATDVPQIEGRSGRERADVRTLLVGCLKTAESRTDT